MTITNNKMYFGILIAASLLWYAVAFGVLLLLFYTPSSYLMRILCNALFLLAFILPFCLGQAIKDALSEKRKNRALLFAIMPGLLSAPFLLASFLQEKFNF